MDCMIFYTGSAVMLFLALFASSCGIVVMGQPLLPVATVYNPLTRQNVSEYVSTFDTGFCSSVVSNNEALNVGYDSFTDELLILSEQALGNQYLCVSSSATQHKAELLYTFTVLDTLYSYTYSLWMRDSLQHNYLMTVSQYADTYNEIQIYDKGFNFVSIIPQVTLHHFYLDPTAQLLYMVVLNYSYSSSDIAILEQNTVDLSYKVYPYFTCFDITGESILTATTRFLSNDRVAYFNCDTQIVSFDLETSKSSIMFHSYQFCPDQSFANTFDLFNNTLAVACLNSPLIVLIDVKSLTYSFISVEGIFGIYFLYFDEYSGYLFAAWDYITTYSHYGLKAITNVEEDWYCESANRTNYVVLNITSDASFYPQYVFKNVFFFLHTTLVTPNPSNIFFSFGSRINSSSYENDNANKTFAVYNCTLWASSVPWCHECPEGFFCHNDYKIPCSAGSYCNQTGLFEPQDRCPQGYFCPSGSITPLVCEAGYFCNETGLGHPYACPLGSICLSTGSIEYIPCPPSYYCPNPVTQILCPAYFVCPSGTIDPISCPNCTVAGSSSVPQASDPAIVQTSVNSGSDNTVQNAILGGAISGGIGIMFFLIRFYLNFRANQRLQQILNANSMLSISQQKFMKEAVKPITIKILECVSTTSLLGYRSERATRQYVEAIEICIAKMASLGLNLDLPNLEPWQYLLLINRITCLYSKYLGRHEGSCSYSKWRSYVLPDSSPRQFREYSDVIADQVYQSVLQDLQVRKTISETVSQQSSVQLLVHKSLSSNSVEVYQEDLKAQHQYKQSASSIVVDIAHLSNL